MSPDATATLNGRVFDQLGAVSPSFKICSMISGGTCVDRKSRVLLREAKNCEKSSGFFMSKLYRQMATKLVTFSKFMGKQEANLWTKIVKPPVTSISLSYTVATQSKVIPNKQSLISGVTRFLSAHTPSTASASFLNLMY
jgi:hypothetical protein